ncbi:hypothetical protein FLONG3_4128 [Fusarium longipes]|uniref:Uncharacterized protein n=1 Tax=Fusarium longipes TaxID=694270 RepID=A0A395T048_9HYPO|nr:hypothetical protein FLONG3_4128 [Fusarium longipes]
MSVTSRYVNTGITRQLLLVGSSTTATATTQHAMSNSTTTTNFNWCQTRPYAVSRGPRAPLRKLPRAPDLIPSQPRPKVSFHQIEKLVQILTPDVFENAIERFDRVINTLEPEEYCEHAIKYIESVVKGTSPERVNLADIGIPVVIAHEMGCLLFLDNLPEIRNLGSSLLGSASATNYNPSTITMARMMFRQDLWGKVPDFRLTEKRFMKFVLEGKDCNALAVYGENLFMTGKFTAAVPILKQALDADDGIFEWRNMCMLCLAKSYARLGKAEEAEKILEKLEDPDADAEVGALLNRGGVEDKRQRLYSEAFDGRMEAYRELAEIEFEKASKETDKTLKEEHNLWAMEWSRLADPSVKF